MNGMKTLYCRIYQGVFRLALPLLPYRTPEILAGTDRLPELFLQGMRLRRTGKPCPFRA